MTKSLKTVILTLSEQGLTKADILDTLAAEYWIDPTVTRFVNSL